MSNKVFGIPGDLKKIWGYDIRGGFLRRPMTSLHLRNLRQSELYKSGRFRNTGQGACLK